MASTTLPVTIRNLQPGDEVLHEDGGLAYTVEGIEVDGPSAEAEVTWVDGGMGPRFWDGYDALDHVVTVRREVTD